MFAIAPFVVLRVTSDDGDIARAAWAFAIYFGLAWALAMHALIKPPALDAWQTVRVVAFTAIAGGTVAVTMSEWLGAGDADFLTMTFAVGLPEELSKALPILLFVFFSRRAWPPRTYLFLGALSGITFGVTEAVLYATLVDDIASYLDYTSAATVTTVWRLVCGGLIHGCLSALPAYFIGLAYWHRRSVYPLTLGGLAGAAVLHGLYNATASTWFGPVAATFIVVSCLAYVRSGDDIALRLARSDDPQPISPKGETS